MPIRRRGDGDANRERAAPPVRKSLGQHFLNDRRILERIAAALELTGAETVLEIGPGRGSLTALLAERAARLVLVEYDRALAALLRERYAASPHVQVVQADVLSVDLWSAAGGPFRVAGNIPYYITTPIVFHLLERPRPERAVLLVQREVAERMAASPGTPEYGALSVNVQAVARCEILFGVAAGAFAPPPKVDSAVVRLTPRADPVVAPDEEPRFRVFVQAVFGMRRKQMRRALREVASLPAADAVAALRAASVDPAIRAEALSPAELARVARAAGQM